jgi:hypothetical protein
MNNFNPILLQFLALVFSEFYNIECVCAYHTSSEEDFD